MRHSFPPLLLLLLLLLLLAHSSDASAQGFGTAVAISGDDVIIAEALNVRTPGFVYVYQRTAGGWIEAQRLSASDATTGDGFGQSLAVAAGDLLVGDGR